MSRIDLEKLLTDIEKPGRYLGGEVNQIVKEQAAVRVALCFPDVYEVAMSHIGLSVLYHCINRVEAYAAERCYAPWPDFDRRLSESGTPLFSLETRRPLHELDVVGFTLQYELAYPTLLSMLERGGIPVYSRDRDSHHPLVIAGGSGAFNPEPMADFIDGFLIGEGEDAIVEICALSERRRREGWDRPRALYELSQIRGMYVPALFACEFTPGGSITAIRPRSPETKLTEHRIVPDLDSAPFPSRPLVPNVAIVHDRVGIEIQRGCTKSCRFCQAGMIFRPTRQRDPRTVLKLVDESLAATGQDEVSFLSLSIGDYEPLQPLLESFFNRYKAEQIGVSLPSLRTETLTQEVVNEIARGKKHSFTLAPEAGSDRMRRIINKGNVEANLLKAVETAVNAGWTVLKYYFMIGLPYETQADIDAIAELAIKSRDVAKRLGKPLTVTVSVSSFVPKPHTPFQWEPQISEDQIRAQQDRLRLTLRQAGVGFRYHNAGQTWAEGVISRGDRRVGDAIYQAFKLGCRMDAWDEYFSLERWQQAFTALAAHGLDWQWYHRRRELDEILPWEAIDSGVDKRFLLKDLARAHREAEIEDCAFGRCQACSACDFRAVEPRVYPKEALAVSDKIATVTAGEVTRLRVGFAKEGVALYLSHLELMEALLRALRRAAIDVAYTQGFSPRPKLGFSPALPMGMASEAEFFDIDLLGTVDAPLFLEQLRRVAPPGMRLLSVEPLDKKAVAVASAIAQMHFAAAVGAAGRDLVAAFDAAETWPMARDRDGLIRTFDLKSEISQLAYSGGILTLGIHQRLDGTIKPDDISRELFAGQVLTWRKIAVTFGTVEGSKAVVSGHRRKVPRKAHSGGRTRDQVQRERQQDGSRDRKSEDRDLLAAAPFAER